MLTNIKNKSKQQYKQKQKSYDEIILQVLENTNESLCIQTIYLLLKKKISKSRISKRIRQLLKWGEIRRTQKKAISFYKLRDNGGSII